MLSNLAKLNDVDILRLSLDLAVIKLNDAVMPGGDIKAALAETIGQKLQLTAEESEKLTDEDLVEVIEVVRARVRNLGR